jgi:hypothetical protein
MIQKKTKQKKRNSSAKKEEEDIDVVKKNMKIVCIINETKVD